MFKFKHLSQTLYLFTLTILKESDMYSVSKSHSVVSDSLQPHGLYRPWNSPGQSTGVGSHFLLQGIFPTQGSNLGLPHCRRIFYQLSHQGSPRILEWVACPFSSGSSWPRNWTGVFCIAGRFFTNWAIREAGLPLFYSKLYLVAFSIIRFKVFLLSWGNKLINLKSIKIVTLKKTIS